MSIDSIPRIYLWFRKARPNPTTKDFSSQLGCHFEEVVEQLDCLSASDGKTFELLRSAREAMNALAEHLKAEDDVAWIQTPDRTEFLDSICDQIVTGVGVAWTQKMNVIAGLDEVNRSNWSKFDHDGEPILHPDTKKVLKGPLYSPADLTPFV